MKSANKTKPATKRKNEIVKRKRQNAITIIRPLTASALKSVLWETLNDVKTEQMLPNRADAIAAQSREILRTIKTQLQVAGQAKRGVPSEIIEFSEQR
jgi:hypothetical protein